jgi:hypothetical protein
MLGAALIISGTAIAAENLVNAAAPDLDASLTN